MPKQPSREELEGLKDQFLKSVADYLDDCIAHGDTQRMRRFVASVRDTLKHETQRKK
jgi:predicted HicB family RNase H-like nuclease